MENNNNEEFAKFSAHFVEIEGLDFKVKVEAPGIHTAPAFERPIDVTKYAKVASSPGGKCELCLIEYKAEEKTFLLATNCNHLFCKECLEIWMNQIVPTPSVCQCPACGKRICDGRHITRNFEETLRYFERLSLRQRFGSPY